MATSAVHTATKLVDEPWFIEGRLILSRDGVQVATIILIKAVRLERQTDNKPTYEVVFEGSDFSSVQPLDDGAFTDSIMGGILAADPDDDPPAGRDQAYMMLVDCAIRFTATYGSHVAGKVFRRPWRIPASALTAPAD